MSRVVPDASDPPIRQALNELKGLILARYPEAEFEVYDGDDPVGVYLVASVEDEDSDRVMDTVMEKLLDIGVERRLPVYFITDVLERRTADPSMPAAPSAG